MIKRHLLHPQFRLLGLALGLMLAALGLLGVQRERGTVAGSRTDVSPETRITGTLVAPPDEPTAALTVCAVELQTGERQCVDAGLSRDYRLSVQPGQYHVVVQVSGRTRQATYTNRALCPDCQLQPVVVSLNAGEAIEDVNPTDWTFATVTPGS